MTNYSYHSYEQPRTAGIENNAIKSIQSWKTNSNTAKSEIIASLNRAATEETANFKTSLKHASAYAPQHHDGAPTKDAFTFSDIVDIVNPLHHLPVVGSVYRNITGNDLHPMSGIIGGTLYGGPVGAVTGTANAITKIETGKDIGEHAFDVLGFNDKEKTRTEKRKSAADPDIATNNKKIEIEKIYKDDITTLTLAAMPPKQF